MPICRNARLPTLFRECAPRRKSFASACRGRTATGRTKSTPMPAKNWLAQHCVSLGKRLLMVIVVTTAGLYPVEITKGARRRLFDFRVQIA